MRVVLQATTALTTAAATTVVVEMGVEKGLAFEWRREAVWLAFWREATAVMALVCDM